ncbi:MAG: relaxase/mobilization nuclease domain-containing protein [Bacteroidota bacterium]
MTSKRTFEKFTSLNERTTTNTLHVSLNFDSPEILDNEKLVVIAKTYMERIGFGEQPYLVYRHHDAGHPHIHIVSTNIRRDGSRISMHNMGQNESEESKKGN